MTRMLIIMATGMAIVPGRFAKRGRFVEASDMLQENLVSNFILEIS
jgi:hypothetical protein